MQRVSVQPDPTNQTHFSKHPDISAGTPRPGQAAAVCHLLEPVVASRGQTMNLGVLVYPLTGMMYLGHSVFCHTCLGQLNPIMDIKCFKIKSFSTQKFVKTI